MNIPEAKQSRRLRTPWRIFLGVLGLAGGLACYVGFEIDRSIRRYYFQDFSLWHPHIIDVLSVLTLIYFLLVSITGRWRVLSHRR